MLLRLSVAAIFAVAAHAADLCSLFPYPELRYGQKVSLTVDLKLVGKRWQAQSVCSFREDPSNGRIPTAWIAEAGLQLPPALQAIVAKSRSDAEATGTPGAILLGTVEIIGDLTPGAREQYAGTIAVTEIRNLRIQSLPAAQDLPAIGLCDLFKDLLSYNRKRVAVRGEIVASDEGLWLSPAEPCNRPFVTSDFVWDYNLSLEGFYILRFPPPDLAAAKLRASSAKFATLVGTLVLPDEYKVICHFGELFGFGFGHLNASPGVLMVETALDARSGEPRSPQNPRTPRVACQPSSR